MARSTLPHVDLREAGATHVTRRSSTLSLLASLRPEQWTKNLIVFAALIFAQRLLDLEAVGLSAAAFAIFCVLSGVVYLVNDLVDQDADRQHPVKRLRPIASGALAPGTAAIWAAALGAAAVAAAAWLAPAFGLVAAAYLALFAAYSRYLKHVVILDVLSIALGFVLRAAAGGFVIEEPVSEWLLVCTVLLALVLGLGKRRHEITLLAAGAVGHRRILDEYNPYLLDQMIGVVTASTLMAYIIYVASPDTVERFGTHLLVLTVPFPIYGILRYLYLVHRRDGGGNPSELLIADRPLLICVALWGLVTTTVIYRPFGL
ncbi:MAG: decaprenyl-phosphate phosphoribosyltransferase [Vicinamibacterales bacterium]